MKISNKQSYFNSTKRCGPDRVARFVCFLQSARGKICDMGETWPYDLATKHSMQVKSSVSSQVESLVNVKSKPKQIKYENLSNNDIIGSIRMTINWISTTINDFQLNKCNLTKIPLKHCYFIYFVFWNVHRQFIWLIRSQGKSLIFN